MSANDPSQKAFEAARDGFKRRLGDESLFRNLLNTTSIEQVWKMVEDVQAEPHAGRRLRHLAGMRRFFDKLSAYAAIVDKSVQLKPDVMALIWGPIRLLLLWTSNITKFADAVQEALKKIGDALPHAVEMARTFSDNNKLKDLLVLFYEDILDFYLILLKFFSLSRPRLVFESVWPRERDRLEQVINLIERHTACMRSEVTTQNIREEREFRAKTLAHFNEEQEFQELQKFQTLMARVSPESYDDRLDWLLNRSSETSADWFISDQSFLSWLDTSNPTVRLLWLEGIPGAGKTFLSAAVIKEAKTRHRTLFAFVSHAYQRSTTARSILQSLLFQLASDVQDAQSVLARANERDLLGSTRYNSELLKTLLDTSSVGPTYLILDGLDEMEAVERGILLQQLISLEGCSNLKMLVSSRAEHDIAGLLKNRATGIRVDQRNSDSIQSYVKQRTENWIRDKNLDENVQEKVRPLLARLAAKSNGMFLYARIILDNAELCFSLEEIEQELRVLPTDLNDAYCRILSRIAQSSPDLRRKAHRILGWIGCSPVPMTRYEMEQALLIDSTSNVAPSVIASTNFVRICGPIIEIMDESLRFVHFTAKEYIFSRQISDFIDKAEANHSLTKCLLSYLCSGIFNPELSNEQLRQNIVAGKYRLQWFATSQWIMLTRRCVEVSKCLSAYPDLLVLLTRLTFELRNDRFNEEVDPQDRVLRNIDPDLPEVSKMICGVIQFREAEEQDDWNYANSTWSLRPAALDLDSTSF
ncbi:hypothetical protein VTI74DRAFT_6338 [Chaetomium olivicolor]